MTFNPMHDVPETDEQAMIALRRDSDGLTNALHGLYSVHRAKGETVIEAFRLALEAHVAAEEKANPPIA